MSREKLCPVHRSPIAMSGRVTQVRGIKNESAPRFGFMVWEVIFMFWEVIKLYRCNWRNFRLSQNRRVAHRQRSVLRSHPYDCLRDFPALRAVERQLVKME